MGTTRYVFLQVMNGKKTLRQKMASINGWLCPSASLMCLPPVCVSNSGIMTILDIFIVVFFDDILIYSKLKAEYVQYVFEVLHVLDHHQLVI